jgi:hypothetical protein
MRTAPFVLCLLLAGCSSRNDAETAAIGLGQVEGGVLRDGHAIDPPLDGHGASDSVAGGRDAWADSSDGGTADAQLQADAEVGSKPSDASDAGAADVDLDALFNVFPENPVGINYGGGPILTGTVSVYFIWYGNWAGSPAPAILEDMLRGLSGNAYVDAAPYDRILQAYSGVDADGGLTHATGDFQFAGSYYVGYTSGTYLGLGNEENVVANSITYGVVPYDPGGIYAILTSADVTEDLGPGTSFCGTYCAFHLPGRTNSSAQLPFHYVFAGDPMQCPTHCTMRPEFETAGIAYSPNGDWASDALVSLVVHELFETVTDPTPYSGWVSPIGNQEIGDVCAWRFDPTYATDAGSRANVHWGDRDYLVQQQWVLDDAGGHCGLSP